MPLNGETLTVSPDKYRFRSLGKQFERENRSFVAVRRTDTSNVRYDSLCDSQCEQRDNSKRSRSSLAVSCLTDFHPVFSIEILQKRENNPH